jgi:organic hydroperoxide reductase OsmC/OhrA
MPSHEHRFDCRLTWTGAAGGPTTSYEAYARDLRVEVPGKPPLDVSAALAFRGDPARHNPEDLLLAALSTCHCLSYLALSARAGIAVVAYEDDVSGILARAVDRKLRFTEVTLHPRVRVAPGADRAKALALHDLAHEECFIARSMNFPVRHEPTIED